MVSIELPRVVIAGLCGSSGKTLVSVGLARALRNQGLRVSVFKKGPDFIDAAWLGTAAGIDAHNLDTFLAPRQAVTDALCAQPSADIAIIEGNRGLFDGFDAHGTHSTAELAKLIQAPVVLVVDATKSTRTVAALVLGCRALDADLNLAAVILNRVGTPRQERLIRDALSLVCNVPILGAIPRLHEEPLPSRHLGLVLPAEREDAERALEDMATAITTHVDLMSLRRVASAAPRLHVTESRVEGTAYSTSDLSPPPNVSQGPNQRLIPNQIQIQSQDPSPTPTPNQNQTAPAKCPRIGVLRDAAFCFYYPENLAALEAAGATLVPISPLSDRELAPIDALYAGGGYPEQFADTLSRNTGFRSALANRIYSGLPVWAECGGLMYLSSAIVRDGVKRPMLGVLPFIVEHTSRPQAHGYIEALVDTPNPYLSVGTRLRGHEFHHSRVVEAPGPQVRTALALERGTGLGKARDGIVVGRVFASYLHLFAPGNPEWAKAFVRVTREVCIEPPEAVAQSDRGDNNGKYISERSQHRSRRGWVHSGTRQVE